MFWHRNRKVLSTDLKELSVIAELKYSGSLFQTGNKNWRCFSDQFWLWGQEVGLSQTTWGGLSGSDQKNSLALNHSVFIKQHYFLSIKSYPSTNIQWLFLSTVHEVFVTARCWRCTKTHEKMQSASSTNETIRTRRSITLTCDYNSCLPEAPWPGGPDATFRVKWQSG